MNETTPMTVQVPGSIHQTVLDWLRAQSMHGAVLEPSILLNWITQSRVYDEPRPYRLRARVAGDTIRDLIEALQQLDPDLKHGVEEVVRGNGWVDGLGIEPEKYARLEEEVEDKSNYESALIDIRDSTDASAKTLRDIAREALE